MRPLALISLLLFVPPLSSQAETPEEVKRRLDFYRQVEAQRAEQARKTREWQRRRDQEEAEARKAREREAYLRTWKVYGADEINVLAWKLDKKGAWVTDAKFGTMRVTPEAGASRSTANSLSSGLPSPSSDRVWIRVRAAIGNGDLADRLSVPRNRLADLNDVNEEHLYDGGDWVVLPSQMVRLAKQIASLDTSDMRRTPPLTNSPFSEELAVVRFGDTVFKIAQRYGLTLSELLRLNPGMETARLVVGSPIRLAEPAPRYSRMMLGLRPSDTGGIRWPELPEFTGRSESQVNTYPLDRVAVNCNSLLINKSPAFSDWGKWNRPSSGSPEEQIVIDRCSKGGQ